MKNLSLASEFCSASPQSCTTALAAEDKTLTSLIAYLG